jgi:hypothetical protein
MERYRISTKPIVATEFRLRFFPSSSPPATTHPTYKLATPNTPMNSNQKSSIEVALDCDCACSK